MEILFLDGNWLSEMTDFLRKLERVNVKNCRQVIEFVTHWQPPALVLEAVDGIPLSEVIKNVNFFKSRRSANLTSSGSSY
ncbi:MAG: hypothetical protein N2035_04425 [Chthoniobacterales bacterium]|nr:hypothetical protein [Chthoniobacterales bacterium]